MNTTNTEGVFDQAKGKVKQAVGETFNDQSLANEGAADQVKGHVKEAWGNVKDTAGKVRDDDASAARAHGETTSTDARNSVTRAAESVKDSVNRGLDSLKSDHAKH